MLVPDSYTLTATSSSFLDLLKELENHIKNTSTKFDHKNTNDDTGGSGEYGITITPSASGETWNLAIHYNTSHNGWDAFIDPEGQITNPLDQTSGSSKTSPEDRFLQDFNNEVTDKFGVAETANTLSIFTLSSSGGESDGQCHAGRIINPTYSDDSGFGIGLGYCAAGRNNPLGNNGNRFQIGDGNWDTVVQAENNGRSPSQFPDGRIRPIPTSLIASNYDQHIGLFRPEYRWDASPGLTRVDDADGEGGLIVLIDNNVTSYSMIWDPSVAPVW